MRKLLLFQKSRNHDQLAKKVKLELEKQLRQVGTLSASCQQITQAQLLECLPLLLTYGLHTVQGRQDTEQHGATLNLTFRNSYQLVLTVFCPPNDTAPWFPDTKLFAYKGSQLRTYLACHHTQLGSAVHRSLQALGQEQEVPA